MTKSKTLKRNKLWPRRYYKGLSWGTKKKRQREIKKYGSMSWKNPKAYVGFKTDKGVKTKTSSYVEQWKAKFPDATSIKERADASGVPADLLKQSYNRGMAAWRTGHRPGATAQQWGHARVASLLVCGKTHYGPDSDLVKKAKTRSKRARKWWSKTCKK
jgi:hypothetical protein